MSFPVENSYFPLDSYSYREKSPFISSLDILSAPCRSLLGGKRVDVLSQTFFEPMSTKSKVVLVVLTFLMGAIMPSVIGSLALLSASSLLIKLVSFPWKWEAEIIKDQSAGAWSIIKRLEKAALEKNDDEVIRIFKAHPELKPRDSAWEKFAVAVRSKIDSGAPWEETKENLRIFSDDEAVDWAHYAVEKRFMSELAKNEICLRGEEIFLFAIVALKGDKKEVKKCYMKMFSTFLQPKEGEDLSTKMMKLGLAHQMMMLESTTEKSLMRLSLFPSENSDPQLRLIAFDEGAMESLAASTEKISRINSIGSACLGSLEKLLNPTEPISLDDQWKAMHHTVACFKIGLKHLVDPGEEIYRSSLQTRLNGVDRLVKNLQNPDSSSSDILALIREEEDNLTKEMEKLSAFTPLGDPADATTLEYALHVLHQKKRTNIAFIIATISNKLVQFLDERVRELYV